MKTIATLILTIALLPAMAWATVGQQPYTVTYACTGSLGPYSFTYPISDPTSMRVTIDGATIGTSLYTIVPINNNYDNGGNVTLTGTTCTGGHTLVLNRFTNKTQTTVYIPNMPPKTTENDLDKNTEIDQEMWGRTVHSIQTQAQGVNIGIPSSGGDITYNFADCTVTGSQTGQPPTTQNLFTVLCGGGGGGGAAGTLGWPIYGTGPSIISRLTGLVADDFPGSDICAKVVAAEALLPATGGKILLSCQNYAACAAPLTITKRNTALEGCVDGNALIGLGTTGGTTLNFAAGVSGIVATDDRPSIKNMMLSSASTTLGTDDGIVLGSVSDITNGQIVENVGISGFGRHGINFIDGTDFANITNVDVDHVKGDGFHWTGSCFDNNAQHIQRVSSTFNGGYGYRMDCGGVNTIFTSHASSNTAGAWLVAGTSNYIQNAYSESGPGSTFTLTNTSNYNYITFAPFGQPTTITDSSAGGTNHITKAVFPLTGDGQYLAETGINITGLPQNSPPALYALSADTGSFGTRDFVFRDRVASKNIYDYVPSTGFSFLTNTFITSGTTLTIASGATLNCLGTCPGGGGTPGGSNHQIQYNNAGSFGGDTATTDGAGNWNASSLTLGGTNHYIDIPQQSAPSNPSAGVQRVYADSGTNKLSCLTSSGGNCAPSGGSSAAGPVGTLQGTDGSGNFTATAIVDNGATVVSSELLNVPQLTTGAGSPACGSTTSGCWSAAQGTTSCTPTAGHNCIRATSTGWVQTVGTSSETPLGNPGTVTSVSVGNLSPIFTTTTSNSTTTPLTSFIMSNIAAHRFLGNNTGSPVAIAAVSPACADLSDASPFCNGTAAATLSAGALANGMAATTQTVGDNTTKLATDAFVIANVAVGAGTGFNGGAGSSYQDGLEIASPSNPAATFDRAFFNISTHLLDCKTSSGSSCMPSAGTAAFNTITSGTNTTATMNVGSGASFLVNYNAASLASPLTGTLFQAGNADGVASRNELDCFANSCFFTANRSNGTAASPSSLVNNDQIGGYNGFGHNGTSVVGPNVSLRTYAAQNWSVGSNGTYADIATTPNGSTTLTEVERWENDGGITIPATVTGGSKGAGTLNAGGLYVNGVAVSAPATLTYYPISNGAASAITFASSADAIRGTQFTLLQPVTFSNLYIPINVTDASNPVYGAAIINVGSGNGGFGTSGTAVCHNTSGVQLGSSSVLTAFPCAEGSVTLQPGNYAMLTTSHSTVGKFTGTVAFSTFWTSTAVAGCTASNGVITFSTPCTVSFVGGAGGIMANALLH